MSGDQMQQPMFRLDGKTALVTGASSGLGAHFAITLAQAGAEVVVAARRMKQLQNIKQQIEAFGARALTVEMDVTDSTSIASAFEIAGKHFGGVNLVVNNAGVATTKTALEVSEYEWDDVVDTNLKGAWLVAQTAARQMVANGDGGNIVNIASILSYRVGTGVVPYIAAKAGLKQLTKALALEWARYDIRVNAIAPGYILTDMNRSFFATDAGSAVTKRIPQRRIGQPEDLDGALLLLCSDASRYMTGSVIVVDGGHLQSSL